MMMIVITMMKKMKKSFKFELYGPCPDCLGWILRRSMKRHQQTCCCKENSKNKNQTKSSLLVQSDIIAGNISPLASKTLVEETYAIMKNDHISEVAKSDPLIVLLGNNWMLRNLANKIMRKYYTSSTMRLNANFKLALLKSLGNPKKDLVDLLIPSNYELIAKAALSCCNIDEDDELGSPSNAIKLGYDVKRLISAKQAEAIKDGVKDRRKEAEQLLKLMDLDWGIKVKKLASITLQERAFNAPKQLPLPEDIQRLAAYLQDELKEISLDDVSCENFRRVAIVTLARITLFNRRRAHEVQAMSLNSYRDRKSGVDEVAKELTNDLTSFENYLLNTQEVVVIRGKTGKGVPCILPQDVQKPLQYLSSPDVRSKVTMKENQYVFVNSNTMVSRTTSDVT